MCANIMNFRLVDLRMCGFVYLFLGNLSDIRIGQSDVQVMG